jgi:hypothetical protein
MSALVGGPQGIDAFAEGLASFEQQSSGPPTAAVESASLNVPPKTKVTIMEPPQEQSVTVHPEEESSLRTMYEENQVVILSVLAVAIGYYFYKRR